MKNFIKLFWMFFVFLSISNSNSYSQIKVFDNGFVGVNYLTSTPASRFTIISISGGGLYTYTEKGSSSGKQIVAHLTSSALGNSNYNYGLYSTAYSATVLSVGRSYGVFGQAGNATTGYNYALYGYLGGTNRGAAIFGAVNGYGDIALDAQYAGYFRGNVKCENIITCYDLVETSDEKFKTNVVPLESRDAILNIMKINPVKYNLKQREIIQTSGDTTSVTKYFNETDQIFTKTRFGVLAQELQKIYPDLVFEEGDGSLSVKYTGLIPVLIKAIQDQQKRIDDLEAKINKLIPDQSVPAIKQ
jgi:hypothetical protein